jgi:hypothetical protein
MPRARPDESAITEAVVALRKGDTGPAGVLLLEKLLSVWAKNEHRPSFRPKSPESLSAAIVAASELATGVRPAEEFVVPPIIFQINGQRAELPPPPPQIAPVDATGKEISSNE